MQRTLKREFKELEIVKREAIEVSRSIFSLGEIQFSDGCLLGQESWVGGGIHFSPFFCHLVLVCLGFERLSGGVLFSQGELASVFPLSTALLDLTRG